MPRPPRFTLFPYTTLFRSHRTGEAGRVQIHRRLDIEQVSMAVASSPHLLAADRTGQLGGRRTHWRHVVDRKSTRLNSSHMSISYAVFCLKKKTISRHTLRP